MMKYSTSMEVCVYSFTISLHFFCYQGNFSVLRIDFVLKRHMGYYILQVYIPSSMLVILSWVSFFIHREATADRVNIGAMTFLSLTTLSFDIRTYTAVVPYLTALDWFVIMSYSFLLASLLQFAFVHYFTKFGYGEEAAAAANFQHSTDYERIPRGHSRSTFRPSISVASGNKYRPCWTNFARYLCRFWFCLTGSTRYKHVIRKRSTRIGVNSRSDLDVFARIVFPLSFVLFNILYWFYFLQLQH